MALVVGTVLLMVNQGSQLLSGEIDSVTVLRAVANYAIPYVVSSIGYLDAANSPRHQQGQEVTPR